MKNLTKKIMPFIATGIIAFSSGNLFGQNSSQKIEEAQIKVDSIYNSVKTHEADSSYMILSDRNKDKIIDSIIYMHYYPKICLTMSSLDNNYDGFFETTTKKLSYENSWTDLKESGNLNYLSQSFNLVINTLNKLLMLSSWINPHN